jgi:hypothetical protein
MTSAIQVCGEMLRDVTLAINNGEPFRLWVTDQPPERDTLFALTVAVQSE